MRERVFVNCDFWVYKNQFQNPRERKRERGEDIEEEREGNKALRMKGIDWMDRFKRRHFVRLCLCL
jgi:hypothetical protein